MKNRLKIITNIILIFSLSFCTTKTKIENTQAERKDTQNKLLTLPNCLTLYNLDTNQSSHEGKTIEIDQSAIIVFINVSCVTCIGDLDFWLENSRKLQEKNIPLVYILRASDDFYFFKFLVENENKELAPGSYFFDINDEFRKLNEELLLNETNTFLINQNLEIITSGNPAKNKSVAHKLFIE
ncbi:hypothetical protein [uncultured Algoriphagus sp.]|uniref:hypothetical protein n=1 Tax=uncultured Algoriphagus sp. TaxID=417365 RepID=UPI0030EB82D5|tara:strand:+ start:3797 stop:4345 length:549 start_codon:yes stop_codon:yes gene_type:complete